MTKNNTEKVSNNSFFEILDNLLEKKESFFCSNLPDSKLLNLSTGIVTEIKRSEIKENGIFIMPFNENTSGYMLSPSLDYETTDRKSVV